MHLGLFFQCAVNHIFTMLTLHVTTGTSVWKPSHHICTSWSQIAAGQHVTLNLPVCDVCDQEHCAPSGGLGWCNRNCSTGSTGCVPPALLRGALTIIEMAQAVFACIVLNQSSRRALKRSAVYSQTQAQQSNTHKQASPLYTACLHYIFRVHLLQFKVWPLFTSHHFLSYFGQQHHQETAKALCRLFPPLILAILKWKAVRDFCCIAQSIDNFF